MEIKVVLDKGAQMPKKAHTADAGFDLFVPHHFDNQRICVCGGNHIVIDTGVHLAIPEGYVGMIKSKSGLNVKYNLVGEGVIDAGYTGSIKVKLYNHGREDYYFKQGDKLTQIVILPIPEVELKLADSLDETERGDGGFGSTGK